MLSGWRERGWRSGGGLLAVGEGLLVASGWGGAALRSEWHAGVGAWQRRRWDRRGRDRMRRRPLREAELRAHGAAVAVAGWAAPWRRCPPEERPGRRPLAWMVVARVHDVVVDALV